MKKIILSALTLLVIYATASAQLEIKTNPLNALLNNPDLFAEHLLKNDLALEWGLGFEGNNDLRYSGKTKSGLRTFIAGKYYFNPKEKADKFSIGLYLLPRIVEYKRVWDYGINNTYRSASIGLGLMAGYKWINKKGILLEISTGVNRRIFYKTTPHLQYNYDQDGNGYLLRLMVGYRFKKKGMGKSKVN